MKEKNHKFVIATIFFFLSILFLLTANWAIKNFTFTFETLMFYIRVPFNGANLKPVFSFIKQCLIPTILLIVLIVILLKNPFKWSFRYKDKTIIKLPLKYNKNMYLILSIILFIISFYISFDKVGLFGYLDSQISNSTFIEENYIDPRSVNITSNNKRNLIYIYVESMESTYFNKNNGGDLDINIMPYLTSISNSNINFSNNNLIGGAHTLIGTDWTVAAIVSQTAGLPLKLPFDGNDYGKFKTFLPGAYTLGDILKENGYNQVFMMGSDGNFGGRYSYLKSHGDYTIYDLYVAKEKEKIDKDYHVWWGFEDNKLFEYAKEEISNLSKEDKPFNFSMLTVDMHFPDGYLSNECESNFDQNLSNVVNCTDNKLKEFVTWIEKQDFYEDTTIIIAGDHLSMDGNYFNDLSDDYERTVYNLFINSCVTTTNYKNRDFSTLDMFPTTLASICFDIEGDKLGLGTNLFSDKKTLIEEYGLEYVNDEIAARSKFYNNRFVYAK